MNPRIASIENLIARDPGGRNVFDLAIPDQLRLAAQSLRRARRVGIVSGFFIPEAGAAETDGPPGAKVVGEALAQLGIEVDYLTDERCVGVFLALGMDPLVWDRAQSGSPKSYGPPRGSKSPASDRCRSVNGAFNMTQYLDDAQPTHLVSIERAGRGPDKRYRNMHGLDITDTTAPIDALFIEAQQRGITTIGIGDGGNEIGMGKVFAESPTGPAGGTRPSNAPPATIIATDFCMAAGVSNWGAYGLAGALSVLEEKDLLPSADAAADDLERIVRKGGAVDGVTHRREPTVDGLDFSHSVRMLENIRRQIAASPLESGQTLTVGVLGFGQSGRAAAALLADRGHRVCISDQGPVTLDRKMVAAGVEAGGHSAEFFADCDLVVASPGVRADAPILNELHQRGLAVWSELELAYQLGRRKLIAVTGTIGKRTTVELLQNLFRLCGRSIAIGGNRGKPLSAMLLDFPGSQSARRAEDPLAVAVSSFQLETVVGFCPHMAVMLNIDEAHLDRHQTIAEYVRIKSRIFMNHRSDDVLILNFDDDRLRPLARKHRGRTLFVSARQPVDRGAWCADGLIRWNLHGKVEEICCGEPPFPINLLSAVLCACLSGISRTEIAGAVSQLSLRTGPVI